jgi:tripartite-type tricarboxylate transporter receptor subunit TctC
MRAMCAAIGMMVLGPGPLGAETYPARNISIIVPFAAGGPTDTVARFTADSMSRVLGQPVVVENYPGAGGTIATERAARARPDGYTLLVHHVGLATSATLYRKLPYDPRSAFAPIGLLTDAPMTIIGRTDLEPNTLADLVVYAKARGDKITFANSGLGAASHLCGMLFQTAIQKQLTTVPYKGNGPIMNDLVGKHIDLTCDQTTNTTGPITTGQVKAYAVTTKTRVKTLPNLPTADEAGLKGFEVAVWHGLYAPKGTPAEIVTKLSGALQEALADERLIQRFADLGTEPVGRDRATPEALQKTLLSEIDRWAPIIKAAGEYAD